MGGASTIARTWSPPRPPSSPLPFSLFGLSCFDIDVDCKLMCRTCVASHLLALALLSYFYLFAFEPPRQANIATPKQSSEYICNLWLAGRQARRGGGFPVGVWGGDTLPEIPQPPVLPISVSLPASLLKSSPYLLCSSHRGDNPPPAPSPHTCCPPPPHNQPLPSRRFQ